MGMHPTYTADVLSDKIDEFIDLCDKNTIPIPDDYHLMKFLNISSRTLDKFYTDGDTADKEKGDDNSYKDFSTILKKLVLYRASWLSRMAMANPKNSFYIFALKQARSGGWSDRQEVAQSGEISLKIDLKGSDGKPFNSG